MDDVVMIDGVSYYTTSPGGMDYENPYFRTDSGLYSVVESIFQDSMRREGTFVEDYWTGQKYKCFFRKNKDTNQTNDNVTIFYPVDSGIEPGAIITKHGKRYLVLNQESIENRVYHRSDGINSDIMLNTYDRDTMQEISIPCFAYDLTGTAPDRSDMMSVIAGNTELMTGDNQVSRLLKVNQEFYAMGNWYSIVSVNFKTGICRVEATTIQGPSKQMVYDLKINLNESYTQGDTVKLRADASVDEGPIANPTLVWSSSDPAVATITEGGDVLFVGIGTCGISCYWKEHDITRTVFVQVVAVPVDLKCEIIGNNTMPESTTANYSAVFYLADGTTKDTTVAPVWSLDVPSDIADLVKITAQSGNTVSLKASNGTRGKSFALVLTDESGQYHATKTIQIKSWL